MFCVKPIFVLVLLSFLSAVALSDDSVTWCRDEKTDKIIDGEYLASFKTIPTSHPDLQGAKDIVIPGLLDLKRVTSTSYVTMVIYTTHIGSGKAHKAREENLKKVEAQFKRLESLKSYKFTECEVTYTAAEILRQVR